MRFARLRIGVRDVWLILAILGLCLVSQAGCIRGTPTPEPVTISFAYPESDTDYYQRLVQTFNETYPHITVELQPKRSDMLSGVGPGDADVFVSSQFAQIWLREQGNILNLTPFVEQDETFNVSDFYPGTLGLYTSEGEIWGIPAGVDVMVMFYNQDVFDLYGVSYPNVGWTWDDFLSTAMAIRDPGADVFGYVPNYGSFDALVFIYQHGGRIFDDLQNPSHTTFDDPLTIEALEWYANLMFEYNVTPTQEQVRAMFGSSGGLRRGIQLGKVGMWTEMLSQRETPWMADMRLGIVSLPMDQQFVTLTLIEGYFISSQAQHADACWQWVSFLTQRLPDRLMPVRKLLAESDDLKRQVGDDIAAVARASMENALLLSPELAQFEQALDVFTQAFEAILNERSTPLEAMTWAQQESKFK